ncbi:DUF2771 domain-containing protein [Allostreptomyces psammosilenae]|uniref:DUF2771 domain-containing protein n=1 Tax=Allostreptomyces psammosilenae TaxID=1892865 RepID=A0A852ZZZ6_9ACTN|nr:DUF2771 domain-containing protein [Allostreptomyces psammosilenae]NYI07695.1 hypothetical protein [Allostreptomyces psammosilenae]
MSIRRRVAAIGATIVGLAALSACEQPTPLATAVNGSTSVHTEAGCYAGGEALPEEQIQACFTEDPETSAVMDVEVGDRLRVGVEPEIAEDGWFLALDGQQLTDPTEKTFVTVGQMNQQLFANNPEEVKLQIVQGTSSEVIGVWTFKLRLAQG